MAGHVQPEHNPDIFLEDGFAIGFRVSVRREVGRVMLDEKIDSYVKAMSLIGEAKLPGVYQFPHEEGGTVIVEVTHHLPTS